MLTKKPTLDTNAAEKFINAAPLATKKSDPPKAEKSHQTYLHIPISRELRNQLKAASALKGKSLYDYCTEILEKSAI
jgi:hypothetical protein